MKLFILSILLISSVAQADTDTGLNMSRTRRNGGKRNHLGAATKNTKTIRGKCMVLEGPGNPVAEPCADLMVVLSDENGTEAYKTRTSAQGQFEFAVEGGKKYLLAPGSKSYEIVAPTETIKAGANVNMQIRQK